MAEKLMRPDEIVAVLEANAGRIGAVAAGVEASVLRAAPAAGE